MERILPGIGLTGYWEQGAPWKVGGDQNWLLLSVLTQLPVESATTPLPGSPLNGVIYIVPAGDANEFQIAARDNGAWVYFPPQAGWTAYVRDTGVLMNFDGTAWVPATAAFAASLATPSTVAAYGFSAAEAQAIFDNALPLQNYTALRAYTGRALSVRITASGVAGLFRFDASDTTSSDNGGTVIVDASLRRWKRGYDGAVDVKWFGAAGDGVANDTTALQAALTASKAVSFGRTSNTYRVTAALIPQSGADLQFNGALLVQSTANTQIFNLDGLNNIRAVGGRFQGAGDFTNVGGLRSAFRGIATTDVFISGCRFTNFGDTALTITAANNVFFLDNVVVGPPGIVAGDGTCAGVLIGDNCTNAQVRGNNISNTCQGVVSGKGCTGVVVYGNNIHDVIGQHGIYMGAGHVNLTINGNTITNVAGQGIKVQNVDTHAFDAIGISIFGNTIKGTGSHGIILVNTTVSPVQLLRDVTVIGNTINTTTLDDGISLTACSGAIVDGNAVYGANRDGIRFSSCSQIVIAKNIIRAARNNGMREQLACSNVSITGNHVIDCCIADTTAEEQGIYVLLGTNYTITDNIVRDSAAHMRYGIQNASTNQATFVVARNVVSGATDYGARFVATGTNMLFYADNVLSGTTGDVLNAPATDQRGNTARQFYGTAAPSAGAWLRGDVMWNTTPSAAGVPGWVCTTAGSPGTWKAMAAVAA